MKQVETQPIIVDQNSVVALEAVGKESDASGATVLSSYNRKAEGLWPSQNEKLAQLGDLVDRDSHDRHFSTEEAHLAWGKQGGKFSVYGSVTRLGVTLGAMLIALGIVVLKGHPVSDAYVPMGGIAAVALGVSYLDKKIK